MSDEPSVEREPIPSGFPKTVEEAKERFRTTHSQDPFDEIAPALLNSADIFDYARETGMVFPFLKSHLKSASYSICIGDQIIYWNERGEQIDKRLDHHEPFCLPRNSIVFIKTEEVFLLPFYMAMRFNLKIDRVHKGILLGTGPLVDPGFEGHLLIPLHNLTTNDYYFYRGQRFVWVEFTKTSKNERWAKNGKKSGVRTDNYVEFPKNKRWMTTIQYLSDAHEGEIRSSLPSVLEDARRELRRANFISYAAIIAAVAIIVGMFWSGAEIVTDVNNRVDGLGSRLDATVTGERTDGLRNIGQYFDSLESKVNARTNELGNSVDQLRRETEQLRQKVDRLERLLTEGENDRTQH